MYYSVEYLDHYKNRSSPTPAYYLKQWDWEDICCWQDLYRPQLSTV